MFSGLTNQVTSWVGGKKGEQEDGTLPAQQEGQTAPEVAEAPSTDPAAAVPVAEDAGQSPTKAGGGMFSNVKSQMTGWLGNASMPSMPTVSMPSVSIPTIPGFSKKNAETEEGAAPADAAAGEVAKDTEGGTAAEATEATAADDEDKSSATEGADSKPGSGPTTPQDDQAGQIGQVTTKVTQGVKSFGSFLYSSVNKAGAKIKETVKDNSILGEFTKEQEAFMKENAAKGGSGQLPWVGIANGEKVKEEILGLSADRRNFVRAPPAGVDFQFDYDVSYTVAQAIMAEDTALEKMRFDLVPKIITEENFWRNYFYRVSLICQAAELGTLGTESGIGQGSPEE
ncbi:synapse-associated protein of 47 kDa isoform X2 [Lutzomyia longipalpis]|uniref:Putative domain in transcription factors and synapse-associated protein n=1 Tax=Lutzomyia longipalpis TaxID=7200 RepID=A0A7G3AHC2_LUTLO|nr:synapse-associated protein of 47 kDa isoform X2 [Lutzomyia longipalpis]